MTFYAHTKTGTDGNPAPESEWERLEDHLQDVAKLAGKFADAFGAKEWGQLAGLWHDLGKYSSEFQEYLKSVTSEAHLEEKAMVGKVDHSTAGAQHADSSIKPMGRLLAYLIAGHHTGLSDGIGSSESGSSLEARLKKSIPNWSRAPSAVSALPKLTKPPAFAFASGHATGFFLRMLFSCLVDADFLSTEAFMDQGRASRRSKGLPTIDALETALSRYLSQFGNPTTEVQKQRADILQACLASAERPAGLFSLTVPTGGGKTLSSLAFALKHARLHSMERIIYVIPFTSIIEQNAKVFRDALAELGDDVVLEHHSNLDPDSKHITQTTRLAAENWDARLIVTTNVQFFESLHAKETSRCRKLHRLARSVIILDEVQTLPISYMQPCLKALEQLSTNYSSSIVLCTATQPSIVKRDDFKIGLPAPHEIIPDPQQLYASLKRVKVSDLGSVMDVELVTRLQTHTQALCIVSTRRHASDLFQALSKSEGNIHLSALMCPEHRSDVIALIRQRVKDGLPCRVISTQLIEAGVDLDFPVVYRSLAGLDSIAQAAGRCNREGKLEGMGQTFVFTPERPIPKGYLRQSAQVSAQVLPLHEDALSLAAIEHFFRLHYWQRSGEMDTKHIMECWPSQPPRKAEDLFLYQFKTCSENFRFIESNYESVIIPWGQRGEQLHEDIKAAFNPQDQWPLARRAQRFIVSIPDWCFKAHVGKSIVTYHDRFHVLNSSVDYHPKMGLTLGNDQPYDPESLISS
jgi:CRISPR-associated endonuclease/helicase Cas3